MSRTVVILALQVLYWTLMAVFLALILTGTVTGWSAGVLALSACGASLAWHLLKRKPAEA